MNHQQLRELVRDHFAKRVAGAEARIDAEGPLSETMKLQCKESIGQDASQLEHGFTIPEDPELVVSSFLEEHAIEFDRTDETTQNLARLIMRGRKAYYEAALSYSDAADQFDFKSRAVSSNLAPKSQAPLMTLEQLVAQHWKYAQIENRWTGKTEGEKQDHVDLLYERLGKDIAVREIGREQAQLMRTTLASYPVNRNKSKLTRGKALVEVLDMTNIPKLNVLTINKYLQTYSGLFSWAEQNGHCDSNPFSGLALRTRKVRNENPRLSFDDVQLDLILKTVLAKTANIEDHHKWGTLIAIHSGARLNEVAQLHLDDVHQVNGIWCFDINQKEGTSKRLKNASSKRVVPIHPRLVEYGFMEYFERMKSYLDKQRLFPQLTYSRSDGYGRNLGRWVNERLLPDLGLKTDQLTFHSFRHTMVRKLLAVEVQLPLVMAIVGHEQGTTTLDTYNRNGFPVSQLLAALEKAM